MKRPNGDKLGRRPGLYWPSRAHIWTCTHPGSRRSLVGLSGRSRINLIFKTLSTQSGSKKSNQIDRIQLC